jgi:uncharacterized protein
MPASLSRDDVRRLLLSAQGLTMEPRAPATKADVVPAIERMGALQIDTISVVARSPYLVLWSRLGHYEGEWLDELLAEGQVFEYWAHAACFLPRGHFGYYRRWMLDRLARPAKRHAEWRAEHHRLADAVLNRIRDEGALRSADFERTDGRKGTGWWDWKAEKIALEVLYTLGELMVARRQAFQRVYDLAERVAGDWDDAATPSAEDSRSAKIRAAVRAMGVAKAEWIAEYLFLNQPKRPIVAAVRKMATEGDLEPVTVHEWDEPAYAIPGTVEAVMDGHEGGAAVRTSLLSPFDPVCWNRERLADLFGFEYQIECYVPEAKRKYGYFSLPILHGGRMVGRLDPKAHRKDGLLEVKSLHLEPGVKVTTGLADGLREALWSFADWHGTPEVAVRYATDPELIAALERS